VLGLVKWMLTACLRTAKPSTAGTDTRTTFAVVPTDIGLLGIGLCKLVDCSKACSKAGEQIAGLQIFGVQSKDGWERRSVSVDERSNSRNRGKSGRKVHFDCSRSV
jgi:hypothetical protein